MILTFNLSILMEESKVKLIIGLLGVLIRLGVLGGVIYIIIKSARNSKIKADKKANKLDESVRKLMEFYNQSSDEMKDGFKLNLKRRERRAFNKYLEALESNTAKRIDKLNEKTRVAIQKFYKYFMKVQLESNIRVYNMLKENKQNELLGELKAGEKRLFNRLVKSIEKNNEIKFSQMDKLLGSRFIRNFNDSMAGVKTGFISLNSAIANTEISIDKIDGDTNWYKELIANNDEIQDLIGQNDILMDIAHDLNQVEFNSFINDSMELNNLFHEENLQEQMRICMNESMKAITPMDFGGYMGGVGFNPSETMQFNDMQQMNDLTQSMQQMNDMNQQMQQSMNDMNQSMQSMDHMNHMNNHNHF